MTTFHGSKRLPARAAAAVIFVALVSPAARAEAPAELPPTPTGAIARAFVDAVNSGDPARAEAFVAAYLDHPKVQGGTPAEYRGYVRKVMDQSGGLDVRQVTPGEQPLQFLARSRKGGHWARVLMSVLADGSGKLEGLGVMPARDPDAPAPVWPSGRLGEAEIAAAVGRYVDGVAARDEFSGVVLVARGDRVLFTKAYGYANRDFEIPNALATRFHLGSMPKMWTALLVGQMVDAGKLSLDDTLAKVLPEYPNREVAAKVTVRQLLTHTSGLGGLFERPKYDRLRKYASHAELVSVFASEPLHFEPGTRSRYSNEGFVVLGAILERLTGRDYNDLVRERIFGPAGMAESAAYALDETAPMRAVGYGRFDDDPLGIDPRRPNRMFVGWRGNACGGHYASAGDLFRFARAFIDGKYVSPATADRLTTKQGKMPEYGMGFEAIEMNGKWVTGHDGGGRSSGINSSLRFFKDGSYTVVAAGNYDAPLASDVADAIARFLATQ